MRLIRKKITIFIVKCITITACMSYIIGSYYPRYVLIDNNHRFDTVTGSVESRSYDKWTDRFY